MSERRSPWHNFSGARLPISDPEPRKPEPCDRNAAHQDGIRFDLWRYSRKVGVIRLCPSCIREFVLQPDPDPRYVSGDAA